MSTVTAYLWLTLHQLMPLWHTRGGWRGRVWYAVATRSWYWWERKEGRL